MKVVILSCLLAAVLGLDYDEVRKAFNGLDRNNDGVLRPDEVLTRFEENDANDDGNITIEEYTARQLPGMPQLVLQGNFNYYDKLDGAADGVISLSLVVPLFDLLDADDDGEVTLEDYQTAMPQIVSGIQDEIEALYAV